MKFFMKFLLNLLVVQFVYSQSLDSTLTALQQSAYSIPNIPCSSQILMTLNEVENIYSSKGLNQEFLSALSTLKNVSGDLPAATQFRTLLDESIKGYTELENSIISLNTTVFKTGPGLPLGFGKKSNSSRLEFNYNLSRMTLVKELQGKVSSILSRLEQVKKNVKSEEISKIQDELHEIDEKFSNGVILESDGTIAPGQGELTSDISDAHEIIADLLESID